ncbi:hypothetical protein EJ03DRAFT_303978 [Teratosphaeria nubilosa]|uniref:PCI domain-containing protein n=1 Tax=Teratosphaeria nubilosa TaxID=161662 RepID=A0A6G1LQH3_9PEZI|nr:hypothetical protein EJ03DRAFT_303978 [Teratosphaeria nubilosa]
MQASPSFTAVSARQTLPRPPSPARGSSKVEWPPGVRDYVQRAFASHTAIPGIDKAAVQEKLKNIITESAAKGVMDSRDWNTYPLPQQFLKDERDHTYSAKNALTANLLAAIPPAMSPTFASVKRKTSDEDMDTQQPPTPPWKKAKTKGSLEERMTGRGKTQDKKQKKTSKPTTSVEVSADVLEKRKQRFGYVTPEPSPYLSSRNESPEPISVGPLVGTSQNLEKSYFRLTAPPPKEDVRSLAVLEKSLQHVRSKWKKEHNYNFACDQLKSIRQDLTVQHIKNELTVKVYEAHARIALEMKDLGEYNQCQTQLRALYKQGLPGNSEEFIAYRILYIIYTCNRTDMNNMLADLTPADKQKDGVKHALAVRAALASGNYHKFFKLYRDTPKMGPYLLDMIIQCERLAAMAALCRTYKPDISLRFLAHELAFDYDDDDCNDPDESLRKCLEFLCQHSGEQFVERKEDGEVRFKGDKAAGIFENAKQSAFGAVNLKGQI